MITKFKLYEALNVGEPKVGDYVLVDSLRNNDLGTYLKTHMGKIILKKYSHKLGNIYTIQYDDIPIKEYRHLHDQITITIDLIKYWCKNKRSALIEFEPYITANKYNL